MTQEAFIRVVTEGHLAELRKIGLDKVLYALIRVIYKTPKPKKKYEKVIKDIKDKFADRLKSDEYNLEFKDELEVYDTDKLFYNESGKTSLTAPFFYNSRLKTWEFHISRKLLDVIMKSTEGGRYIELLVDRELTLQNYRKQGMDFNKSHKAIQNMPGQKDLLALNNQLIKRAQKVSVFRKITVLLMHFFFSPITFSLSMLSTLIMNFLRRVVNNLFIAIVVIVIPVMAVVTYFTSRHYIHPRLTKPPVSWIYDKGDTRAGKVRAEFETPEPGKAVLKFNIPGVRVWKETINGVANKLMEYPGEYQSEGSLIRRFIAVPQDVKLSDIELETIVSDSLKFADSRLNPEASPDADSVYAGNFVRINGIEKIRDQTVVSISISPLHYNEKKGEYRAYNEFKIEMSYPAGRVGVPMGTLGEVARHVILNYNLPPSMPARTTDGDVNYTTDLKRSNIADVLIITPDVYYQDDNLKKYAEFRSEFSKLNVTIVNTRDIYNQFPADSLKQSIKLFVRYAFNNWKAPNISDRHIGYMLMIGNTPEYGKPISKEMHMPIHFWYKELFQEYVGNDKWYSDKDIPTGRFPANNAEELAALIDKTINFERASGSWKQRVLSVDAFYGTWGTPGGIYLEDQLKYREPYEYVALLSGADTLFKDKPKKLKQYYIDYFNRGVGVVSKMGHGAGDGEGGVGIHLYDGKPEAKFTAKDVYQLRNYGMTPIIMTMSCATAKFFGEAPSLGEAFVNVAGKGAVAYYGATATTSNSGVTTLPIVFANEVTGLFHLGPATTFNADDYVLLGDPILKFQESILTKKKTIYVAQNGNVVADGTPQDPFSTILLALEAMEDVGGTIIVGPGEYNETSFNLWPQVTLKSAEGPAVTALNASKIFMLEGSKLIGFYLEDMDEIRVVKGKCDIHNNIFRNNGLYGQLWFDGAIRVFDNYNNMNINISNNVFYIKDRVDEDDKKFIYFHPVERHNPSHDKININNNIFIDNPLGLVDSAIVIADYERYDKKNLNIGYNGFQRLPGPHYNFPSPITDIPQGFFLQDPEKGDYQLSIGSPGKDAGNPDTTYNDEDWSRNDMGAFGGHKVKGYMLQEPDPVKVP
ncbi:C25 family cysteine peptidase, partial [Elusimicrobiota bacterium]